MCARTIEAAGSAWTHQKPPGDGLRGKRDDRGTPDRHHMTPDDDIPHLVNAWKKGELTLLEFSAQMAEQLRKLPDDVRDNILRELSADADDDIKSTAAECRTLLHH